jgi:hypothetical protein
MRKKNWRSKRAGKGKRQAVQPQKRGPGAGALQGKWVRLLVEQLEPRLAPTVNLTYSEGTPPNTFDPQAIAAYAEGLTSTNFTLRAVKTGASYYWNLYGAGTDLVPIPQNLQVPVVSYQITQANDLGVKFTRDDNGASDIALGLSLKDFVGDRLTIDMDSLAVLNSQYVGTPVSIDFDGGKDVDTGAIIGVAIPSPLNILNDQVVLVGTGAGGAIQRDVTIHSSSDISDNSDYPNDPVTSVVATVKGDLTIKSDVKIALNTGSSLTANNISLQADGSG